MWGIEARGVTKTYGDGQAAVMALRGVDLQVAKGRFLAIMGPSGSGKSSLLYILGGMEQPTSGQVLVEGEDLAAMDDKRRTLMRRQRLGFIFQAFNLLPALTAEENVRVPLQLGGLSTRGAAERAAEALELVGIGHRRRHLPSSLSGGEQQRVAIARALAARPAVLLADEPTGNLDSANSRQVTDILRRLVDQQQQTLVMVTHDAEVAGYADQIIRFRDGQVESDGIAGCSRGDMVQEGRQ